MSKQDDSPPKEHLFTVKDQDLGRISFLFYVPDCKEKKPLCRSIKQHGGVVVDTPGCCIYQLKPSSVDENDLNPGLYAENILYDAKWVDDCIVVGKLISKKQYIIKDFVGQMKTLQSKAPFSIIECLRMYDTVEVRGAGGKGKSRSFWNKVSGTGFFPGRSYESLLNKWKQTLSNYTRSQYTKLAIQQKIPFSSSHARIPLVRSDFKRDISDSEEEKKEEIRYLKRKKQTPSKPEQLLTPDRDNQMLSRRESSQKKIQKQEKKKEKKSKVSSKTSSGQQSKGNLNGQEVAVSQASQLSLQALNVIAPKQDRKLKWYEPQIQKKEIQSQQIQEKASQHISEEEKSIESQYEQPEEEEELKMDGWTPNLDTEEVGERIITLDKRFQERTENNNKITEEEGILLRKIVLSDGIDRRIVEDEMNVSQLDTSGELQEYISQIQENYKEELKNSEEIYNLIDEFDGDFDEIENTLKARRRQTQQVKWSELEDTVICEAAEDSKMFRLLLEKYGEELVKERKRELSN